MGCDLYFTNILLDSFVDVIVVTIIHAQELILSSNLLLIQNWQESEKNEIVN